MASPPLSQGGESSQGLLSVGQLDRFLGCLGCWFESGYDFWNRSWPWLLLQQLFAKGAYQKTPADHDSRESLLAHAGLNHFGLTFHRTLFS